ncbi:MAG TPA: RraA family protein [Anaerolineae bacterium]
MSTLSPVVLEKLRSFDTPTICNLIELFDIRPRNVGYMDARITACFPEMPPVIGFAATATFRSAAPPRAGDTYGSIATQVERFGELSGPAVVVFQDLDDPAAGATFGEVMCTSYQAFGSVGLITSGAGRDLEQVRALNYPVFTGGTICSHGYTHIPEVHMPVHVGGIAIYPDDLLHGDVNGVSTIPKDIAAEVADIGDEFVAIEGIILGALTGETPSVQRLKEARAEAADRVAQLRRQVSRTAL